MKVGELIANSQKAKLDAQNSQLGVQKLKAGIEQNKEVMSLKRQEMLQGFKRHQDELNLKNKELNQSAANNYFNISKDLVKNSAESIRHSKAPENAYEAAAEQFSDNNWGFLGKAFFKGMAIREKDKREQKEADEKKKMYDDFMQEYGDVFQYMQAATDYSNALVQRRQQKELAQKETTDFIAKIESSDLSPEQKDRLYSQYFRNLGAQMGDSAQYEGRDELGQNIMITDGEGKLGKFTNPYQIEQQVKSNQERRLQEQQRQNSSQQQVEQRAQEDNVTTQQQQMSKNEEQVSNALPMQQQQQDQQRQDSPKDQMQQIEPLSNFEIKDPETGRSYTIPVNANGEIYTSDAARLPENLQKLLMAEEVVVDDPDPEDNKNAKKRLFGDGSDEITRPEKLQEQKYFLDKVLKIEEAVRRNSWQGWSKSVQGLFALISSGEQNIQDIINSGAIDFVVMSKQVFGQAITQSEFAKILEGVPNKLMGKDASLYLLNQIKGRIQQKNSNLESNIKRDFYNLSTRDQKFFTEANPDFLPNLNQEAEDDPSNPGLMQNNDKNDQNNSQEDLKKKPIESQLSATSRPLVIDALWGLVKGAARGVIGTFDAAEKSALADLQNAFDEGTTSKDFLNEKELKIYDDLAKNGILKERGQNPYNTPGLETLGSYDNSIGYNPETASTFDKVFISLGELASPSAFKNWPGRIATALGVGASVKGNFWDAKTDPGKHLLFSIFSPFIGVGAIGATKSIQRAIGKIPDKVALGLYREMSKRVARDISPGAFEEMVLMKNKGVNGVSPVNYIDAENPSVLSSYSKKMTKNKELDAVELGGNTQKAAKDIYSEFGNDNLKFDDAVEKIKETPKPNEQYSDMIKNASNNSGEVSVEGVKENFKKTFEDAMTTGIEEKLDAAKQIFKKFQIHFKKDDPFANIYEQQLSKKFKDFTADPVNKKLIKNNILKTTEGSVSPKFEKFVFDLAGKGFDATKLGNVQKLRNMFGNKEIRNAINSGKSIVDNFVEKTSINLNEALDIWKNTGYDPKATPFSKKDELNKFKNEVSGSLKDSNETIRNAFEGMSKNYNKPGWEITEELYSPKTDKEALFKAMDNFNAVLSSEKMLSGDALNSFKDLQKLKVLNDLDKMIAGGNSGDVIKEYMRVDKPQYMHAFGDDFDRILNNLNKIDKAYKKATAAPAKTGQNIYGGLKQFVELKKLLSASFYVTSRISSKFTNKLSSLINDEKFINDIIKLKRGEKLLKEAGSSGDWLKNILNEDLVQKVVKRKKLFRKSLINIAETNDESEQ